MPSANCVLLSIVCTLLIMFTGCTRPYSPPNIEEAGKEEPSFDGLLDHAQRVQSDRLRIGVTHGMCHRRSYLDKSETDNAQDKPNWAEERFRHYAKALGVEPGPLEKLSPVGGIARRRGLLKPPGTNKLLEFVFLVWSPLTRPIKQQISYDSGAAFPYKRAKLNKILKELLLNDCLADAVIYLGRAGDPIRNAMKKAVCELLDGQLHEAKPNADVRGNGGTCRFAGDAAMTDMVLASDSLGSKIIFDAVNALRKDLDASGAEDNASMDFVRAVGRTQALYLLSNQLPLLRLAELSQAQEATDVTTTPSGLAGFLEAVNAGRSGGMSLDERNVLENFEVIAFTDPNDALSYRLLPDRLGVSKEKVRVVNVMTSNSDTWLWLVSRPDLVHLGYNTNPEIVELLMHGHHPTATD